jgi:hypothetical protein
VKRFRWRQHGACPFTCPVCQDAVIHERHRVVTEVRRPFREPVDLPYAEMVRCPRCGHGALVERGFGDGFRAREDEEPYDALVRFFGREHREVALADAYRNAKVDLMSNDSRWQLMLNAFAHASYEQFVPPVGSMPRKTTLGRLSSYLLGTLILTMVVTVVAGIVLALLPERLRDIGTVIGPLSLGGAIFGMTGWHAWCFWKEWSVEIHRRRSTVRVHRSLARMLTGLDADGSTLRDAKKTALENKWVTAAVDPEKILELIAAGAGNQLHAGPATPAAPADTPTKKPRTK